MKKRASGFHGTPLSSYLNAQGVDTVIITGVTMAGCVRHTAEDAIAEGFRPIVVREAVGDRVPGVVEWNLFDIDAKFGDVEPLDRVLAYLDGSTRSRAAPAAQTNARARQRQLRRREATPSGSAPPQADRPRDSAPAESCLASREALRSPHISTEGSR